MIRKIKDRVSAVAVNAAVQSVPIGVVIEKRKNPGGGSDE